MQRHCAVSVYKNSFSSGVKNNIIACGHLIIYYVASVHLRKTAEPIKVVTVRNQTGCIMEEKQYFVYILASKKYGTLYTGITSNLVHRLYQHREGLAEGFTKKYNVHHLVYYEIHSDVLEAITREKRIKKWRRQWKINLIEQNNPQWIDLGVGLF